MLYRYLRHKIQRAIQMLYAAMIIAMIRYKRLRYCHVADAADTLLR